MATVVASAPWCSSVRTVHRRERERGTGSREKSYHRNHSVANHGTKMKIPSILWDFDVSHYIENGTFNRMNEMILISMQNQTKVITCLMMNYHGIDDEACVARGENAFKTEIRYSSI